MSLLSISEQSIPPVATASSNSQGSLLKSLSFRVSGAVREVHPGIFIPYEKAPSSDLASLYADKLVRGESDSSFERDGLVQQKLDSNGTVSFIPFNEELPPTPASELFLLDEMIDLRQDSPISRQESPLHRQHGNGSLLKQEPNWMEKKVRSFGKELKEETPVYHVAQGTKGIGKVGGLISSGISVASQTSKISSTAAVAGAAAAVVSSVGAAVGLGILAAYQGVQARATFKFHEQCVQAIQDPEMGILPFLEKHLTLSTEEQEHSIQEQHNLLLKKEKRFQKLTSPETTERALQILGQKEISPEELRTIAADIERQSFENGVGGCIKGALSAANAVGAALAIPTQGIATGIIAAGTTVFVVINRKGLLTRKIAAHYWKKTEMGQNLPAVLDAMRVTRL